MARLPVGIKTFENLACCLLDVEDESPLENPDAWAALADAARDVLHGLASRNEVFERVLEETEEERSSGDDDTTFSEDDDTENGKFSFD